MVSRPMKKSNRRKFQVAVQLDPDQMLDLDRLVVVRRSTRAMLFRAAVDLFLAVNRSEIPTDLDPYAAYGNRNIDATP